MANRLNPILPNFVSPEELSFVEAHQIQYGVILIHKVIDSLKITKNLGMLLKLGIS